MPTVSRASDKRSIASQLISLSLLLTSSLLIGRQAIKMGYLTVATLLFGLFIPAFAIPAPSNNWNLSHRLIYEFENETWVENIAVRSNGKLLVTLITAPEVWEVDPIESTASLVYKFPNASSALGIS